MSGTAPATGPSMVRADELVSRLETNPAGAIAFVGGKRCLDIEILSNPHVDLVDVASDPSKRGADLARALDQRYLGLREPFSEDSPQAVITRGACSGAEVAGLETSPWPGALSALAPNTGSLLSVHPGGHDAPAEQAAILAVDHRGEGESSEPFAHVVVLGWSGALAERGGRATHSEELLRVLGRTVARNSPLHVFCVTDRDHQDDGFLRECERLRVSLVLTGAVGQADVVTVSRTSLRPHHEPASVSLVRCPNFKAGTTASGMARIRVDVWKGEAEIAFRLDLGSDKPAQAVQVTSQLISASRVTNAERRLYDRVDRLLEEHEGGEEAEEVASFRAGVRDDWARSGYVNLCDAGGQLPIEADRTTEYKLLLLARERLGTGGYDILLSNHSPLRPSLLSEWNTLLLPAFKDARALLEYLRDDVIRQIRQRAESFERVAHARAFEAAVERILADKGGWRGLWKGEMSYLDERAMTAISPTTGVVTKYVYQLVTPRPLVEGTKPVEDGTDEKAEQGQRDRAQVIEWLKDLDAVEAPRRGTPMGSGLALGALTEGGCGVRWDPATGFAEFPSLEQRKHSETASPGTIWFPLAEPGATPYWQECPSIVSRNADVMTWVEEVLADKRDAAGRLDSSLLLGGT